MAETVVAVFDTHEHAVHGVDELRKDGFAARQISIFAPDVREAEGFADEVGVKVLEASGVGVTAGGLLGGVAGWIIGLSALAIPGVGLVVAAGPVAGAIVGALGGALGGGFIGMMVGLGLPKHAAEEYERELKSGRTLVFVHPDGDYARAELALNRAHPVGIHRFQEKVGGAHTLAEEVPEASPTNGTA